MANLQSVINHESPCTYQPTSRIMNRFAIFVSSFPYYNLHVLSSRRKVATHINLVASDFRVNKGQVHILKTICILPNKKNTPLQLISRAQIYGQHCLKVCMWLGHLLGLWPWEFTQSCKALIALLEKGETRAATFACFCQCIFGLILQMWEY